MAAEVTSAVTKSMSVSYLVINRQGNGPHSHGTILVGLGDEAAHIMVDCSYGQYAHYWSHCGMEPRKFLTETKMGYALNKMCVGNYQETDDDACRKEALDMVSEALDSNALDGDQADEMRRSLNDIYDDYGGSHELTCHEIMALPYFTEVFGEYEYIPSHEKVVARHEQFWKYIWIPFIEQLKKELADEQQAEKMA